MKKAYDRDKWQAFYAELTQFDREEFNEYFNVFKHTEGIGYFGIELPFGVTCGHYIPSESLVSAWLGLGGVEFEHAMKYALDRTGLFDSSEVLPGSGDYGADIILESIRGRYVYQLKNYRTNSCGVKSVQEVLSAKAYYNASWAGVITTASSFSRSAETMADKCGVGLCQLGELDFLNIRIGHWLYEDCAGKTLYTW